MENPVERADIWREIWNSDVSDVKFEMFTRHSNNSIKFTVQYLHLELRKEHWATAMDLRLFNIYVELKS